MTSVVGNTWATAWSPVKAKLGFIVVEIALIQRFVLFLGHPTYAMTVVVFLMLLSGGAGSFASKFWLQHTLKIRAVLGAIVALVTLYALLLHTVLGSLVALPFAVNYMLLFGFYDFNYGMIGALVA